MDEKYKKKISDILKSKTKSPECPICHANHWGMNDMLPLLPLGKKRTSQPTTTSQASCIMVVCMECGYINLFSIPIVDPIGS